LDKALDNVAAFNVGGETEDTVPVTVISELLAEPSPILKVPVLAEAPYA